MTVPCQKLKKITCLDWGTGAAAAAAHLNPNGLRLDTLIKSLGCARLMVRGRPPQSVCSVCPTAFFSRLHIRASH